jgi:hypothetical protein
VSHTDLSSRGVVILRKMANSVQLDVRSIVTKEEGAQDLEGGSVERGMKGRKLKGKRERGRVVMSPR